MYLKELESVYVIDNCTLTIVFALVTVAKIQNHPNTNRLKKTWCIIECYSTLKQVSIAENAV